MIDKEFLRVWFREHCDPYADLELPQAPRDLVVELSYRYISLFEAITGGDFPFERASEADHGAGILRGIAGHATPESARVAILYDRELDAAAHSSFSAGLAASAGVALEPYHVEPAAQPLHLVELARALSRESRAGLRTVVVVIASGRVDHAASLVRAQSGLPVVLLLAEPPGSSGMRAGLTAAEQANSIDASAAGALVSTSTAGCLDAIKALLKLPA